MDKNMVHSIHILQYYPLIRKNKSALSEGKWNDLENMLSKKYQTQKVKYCLVTFLQETKKKSH